MAMGGGVIDLENISKPKGARKRQLPSVSMGQMKLSTVSAGRRHGDGRCMRHGDGRWHERGAGGVPRGGAMGENTA